MTPYTAHTNDQLDLYVETLASDLTVAYASGPTLMRVRRMTARLLVRVGAWMLPDKPQMVSDTIFILPKQASDRPDIRTAA